MSSTTTKLPEIHSVYTLMDAVLWLDERNHAHALTLNQVDGARARDITKMFKGARNAGMVVDRKHPLTVHATHTSVAESLTFRFTQHTPKELGEMDERIYQAAHGANA